MPRSFLLPSTIGIDLKALREQCQLTQKDVQRASGLDQSRISRIEKGEVAPSESEVNTYLSALKAPLAKRYKSYLRTEWTFLGQPAFYHPDLDALTRAEQCLQQIDKATREEDDRSPMRGQLQMYRDGLLRLGKYLKSLEHVVAFIGPIGVGKSTAISHATGLLLPARDKDLMERCVLEVAGGRTTLCEVQLKPVKGTQASITVEAQTDEEMHTLISDLCAGLMPDAATEVPDQRRGIPTETETAIRNMAGLRRGSAGGGDKRRLDPLKELATKARSRDELCSEISTLMNLPRRTRTQLWYEGQSGPGELEWLKKTFSDVNRGRIDDVPLPRRIDVFLPRKLVDSSFDITMVDTKGIDDASTAIRPDIEQRLTDPRTLSVLCSSFTDAPNAVAQQLLMHMRAVGETAALRERVAVLVLPQNRQALDVMEDGQRVESKDHGYEVKGRDAIEQLHRLGFDQPPPFTFYDALADDPGGLVEFLNQHITVARAAAAGQIATIYDDINLLLADKERARAVAAQALVLEQLAIFIERNEVLPSRSRRAHEDLLRAMRTVVHPNVLWATTRRRGRYPSFDVYFRIGTVIATDARERSSQCFSGLQEMLEQWKADPQFEGALGLLNSLTSNLEFWRTRFLDGCRRAGEETFRPPLFDQNADANKLWTDSENFYGTGNYRNKVADAFKVWFEAVAREDLHDALNSRMQKSWKEEFLEPLRRLYRPDGAPSVTAPE